MERIEEGSSYKPENTIVKREIESGYIYHSHCYKLITGKTNINRSKERFNKIKDDSNNILNQTDKISNTSDKKLICSTPHTNKKRLRSFTSIFNNKAFIICLSNENALHKVAFESTGEKNA